MNELENLADMEKDRMKEDRNTYCFGCGKQINGTSNFWIHSVQERNFYFCNIECIFSNPFRRLNKK